MGLGQGMYLVLGATCVGSAEADTASVAGDNQQKILHELHTDTEYTKSRLGPSFAGDGQPEH